MSCSDKSAQKSRENGHMRAIRAKFFSPPLSVDPLCADSVFADAIEAARRRARRLRAHKLESAILQRRATDLTSWTRL